MRKKIFKYKIVGVLVFLVQLFIFLFFGYGSYDTFIEFSINRIFSIENFVFLFVLIVFITTFLSLISLVFKRKSSIIYLNINYILIIFFFLSGIIKLIYEDNYVEEDTPRFIFIISIISLLLFVVNFLKYKKVDFFEIDDIGTHND